MASIHELREKVESPWPVPIMTALAAGGAMVAVQAHAWIIALLLLAVFTGIAVKASAFSLPLDSEIDEYRDGDYAWTATWLPIIGIFTSSPLGDATTFAAPEWAGLLVTGLTAGVSGGFAIRASERRTYRVGKRRIRKILAHPDLDAVTLSRQECAEKHRDLINALIASGAVDGINVSSKTLAAVLDWSADDVVEKGRELVSAGLASTNSWPVTNPENRRFSLTPAGVVVSASHERGQLNRAK